MISPSNRCQTSDLFHVSFHVTLLATYAMNRAGMLRPSTELLGGVLPVYARSLHRVQCCVNLATCMNQSASRRGILRSYAKISKLLNPVETMERNFWNAQMIHACVVYRILQNSTKQIQ